MKNFVKVVQANIIARALPFLAMPILTRMYAPEDFATVSLFMSLVLLVSSFSTLKFEWSLPSVESSSVALHLIGLGFIALILSSILLLAIILLLVATNSFLIWNGFVTIGALIYLMPLAVIGLGIKSLLETWHIRDNDLTAISHSKIVESVVDVGVSLASGWQLMSSGLVLAKIFAVWASVFILLIKTKKLLYSLKNIDLNKLKNTFQKYAKEASWSSLTSVINMLSFILPLLIFTELYSTKEVGWYALMNTLALAPIAVFSAALGQSFWSEAAKISRERKYTELKALYLTSTYNLMLFSIPVIIVLAFSPLYISILLGSQWKEASLIMVALIPFVVGKLIFAPTNHLIVLSKQHLQAGCDITRIGLTVLAILVSYQYDFSFFITVMITSLASLAGYIVLFLLHLKVYAKYG